MDIARTSVRSRREFARQRSEERSASSGAHDPRQRTTLPFQLTCEQREYTVRLSPWSAIRPCRVLTLMQKLRSSGSL